MLVALAPRRPRLVAGLVVPLVAVDLAAANASLVVTLPQSVFDTKPEVLAVIERAERDNPNPAPGPFRIHRIPIWDPIGWYEVGAEDRTESLVAWRRKTLEAKHGLRYGVEYTLAEGTTELDAYRWLFHPLVRTFAAEPARMLGARAGDPLVYYPRRSFDLWNTRYFIVPAYPAWQESRRGVAAFLADSELIAPKVGSSPVDARRWGEWIRREDWQVLRNPHALPRAWVVHQARRLPPPTGAGPLRGQGRLREILYPGDSLWSEPGLAPIDLRANAWLEPEVLEALAPYLPGGRPQANESVRVRYDSPQRVSLQAHLIRPGLVVLADVHYPGWRLTLDGRPTPVVCVNTLMRGAAVPAGDHTLVYTYEPTSFRLGLAVTAVGLITAAIGWIRRW
jgi:hypothetical protein